MTRNFESAKNRSFYFFQFLFNFKYVFQIDLKSTAKMFGKKFACGASPNEEADEIVIQGDFIDECISIINTKFPEVKYFFMKVAI